MKAIDIIGRDIDNFIVESISINDKGEVNVRGRKHKGNPEYSAAMVKSYQSFIKEAEDNGYKIPKGPHAFDPNEYIGKTIRGLTITNNYDAEDRLYDFKGPEPTINIDPAAYRNIISLGPVEPWVEIPKGKRMWCKCKHCGSLMSLLVEEIFDPYRSEGCELCYKANKIYDITKRYNEGSEYHKPMPTLIKYSTGEIVVEFCYSGSCKIFRVPEEEYYQILKEGRIREIEQQYKDEVEYVSNALKNKTGYKFIKGIFESIYVKDHDPNVYDESNIILQLRCSKCKKTFEMPLAYANYMERYWYAKLDMCPECNAKDVEEFDQRYVGKKKSRCSKLTIIKKGYDRVIQLRGKESIKYHDPYIICHCDCGNDVEINYEYLMSNMVRSCKRCNGKRVNRKGIVPRIIKNGKE